MNVINKTDLQGLVDFDAHEQLVRTAVVAGMRPGLSRVQFFGRYASWNGFFGSGVAAMCGKIGRCRGLFIDVEEPLFAAADHSVYVASFFFDAARDEFKEHTNKRVRDTHRCLAQATVKGVVQHEIASGRVTLGEAQHCFINEPRWLNRMNHHVAVGYGAHNADSLEHVFHAMGFHLGSELLADREFSVLDDVIKTQAADLYACLSATEVQLIDHPHNAYQWIKIHSGEGDAVEADHFLWATQGVHKALEYTPAKLRDAAMQQVHAGFVDFAEQHEKFFTNVNR